MGVPWYVYPLTLLGAGIPVFLYYKDTIQAYFDPDWEDPADAEDLSTYMTPTNLTIGGGLLGLGVAGTLAAVNSSRKRAALLEKQKKDADEAAKVARAKKKVESSQDSDSDPSGEAPRRRSRRPIHKIHNDISRESGSALD